MHAYYDANKTLPPQAATTVAPGGKDGAAAAVVARAHPAVHRAGQPVQAVQARRAVGQRAQQEAHRQDAQGVLAPPRPSHKEPGLTHYQVFVGPGAAFEPGGPRHGIRSTFTDGPRTPSWWSRRATRWCGRSRTTSHSTRRKPLPKLGWFPTGAGGHGRREPRAAGPGARPTTRSGASSCATAARWSCGTRSRDPQYAPALKLELRRGGAVRRDGE